MSLLQYSVTHHRPDSTAIIQFGVLPPVLAALRDRSEEGGDLRGAAVTLLTELARGPEGWQALKE